ncbi:hypothetical protein F0562_028172 [Nyssa sinensis]|uniref:PA domain-containing protein n=1 Tax=Nyssa sinensis TaxID=561372 RepID=A0A5J5B7S6_9ASTE|nr:hypothetical protein F0562_028172 [Nyssa sinensis]
MVCTAFGNVVLIGNNVTLSFQDIESNFAPAVKGSGACGTLYLAEPLDACLPLINKVDSAEEGTGSPFALIIRDGCSFEDKVRRAQTAGFKAAIVYDNVDGDLVAMAGNSAGIKIHAVFVSKASGEVLTKYAGKTNMELWIIPSFENSAWSIMAISFISLLAMSAVLATCFFVRRHRIRREQPRASRVREFHGMSSRLTIVSERILEFCHVVTNFMLYVWMLGLLHWRTFCPVCKRDARTNTGDPPASERTPLLSSNPASVASSSVLSSFRSSLASSSAIQIAPISRSPSVSLSHSIPISRAPSVSLSHSIASTPYMQQSLQSHLQSPYLSASQSSVDLRHASSQRSLASHLVSPHSLGYPSPSPFNSRYMSPHIPSPGNASSYMGSSSQRPHPLHYSESAVSFSPFASAQSLPGC